MSNITVLRGTSDRFGKTITLTLDIDDEVKTLTRDEVIKLLLTTPFGVIFNRNGE